MGDAFLAQAARGRAARWHYVVGLVLLVAAWFALAIALTVALVYGTSAMTAVAQTAGPWAQAYVELNLPFVPLIPAAALVVAAWHRRPVRSLVTGAPRIAWGRMALAFAAAGALFVGLSLQGGEDPEHPGELAALLRALPLIVVFTPLQAAGEEILFRGYLLQASASFLRSKAAIAILNGVLFAALHAYNPAAQVNVLALGGYFLSGAGLALVALRDEGLELPIGGHIANNLVSFVILAYTQQGIEAEAEDYDPLMHYLTSIAPIVLLLALAWLRPRKRARATEAGDQANP